MALSLAGTPRRRPQGGTLRLNGRGTGFTLLEVLVSISVFVIILVVAANAVNQSSFVLMSTNGKDATLKQFYRARRLLLTDLELAHLSTTTFQQTTVPPSQGFGYDGDAIGFLSPVDPNTLQANYSADGSTFWMRNITYYLIVPANHDQLSLHTCAGVADANGYDDGCPHKVLLRQITDNNNSNPTNPPSIQTLVSPFGPFSRPTGYPSGSGGLTTVAINLLTFRCSQLDGGELSVDMRAVSLPDATRNLNIGAMPLTPTSYLIEQKFSVFPKN